MDPNAMKPAGRKNRASNPPDRRIADTLDDIATVLEQIERHLEAMRSGRG